MTEMHNILSFNPAVDPAIFQLRPDFQATSLLCLGFGPMNEDPAWVRESLAVACGDAPHGPPWAAEHLRAWGEAYRAFGAKPQRTPSSAEALRKRALAPQGVPSIGPVVDLYNAISIAFAVPVGGEDIDRYRGSPRLARANGTEPFETVKDGAIAIEYPEPGEAIWRDDAGATCRRWNWRQGPRTRIDGGSRNLWFILERLSPMPLEGLEAAAGRLADGLLRLCPEARIATSMLKA